MYNNELENLNNVDDVIVEESGITQDSEQIITDSLQYDYLSDLNKKLVLFNKSDLLENSDDIN